MKNRYTPAYPSILYKSVVLGVYIAGTCLPDDESVSCSASLYRTKQVFS